MPAPSFSTYAGLVAAVSDWPGRGDARYLARVPDFIALGEARIWRKLRVSDMIVSTTLVVPGAQNWVAVPVDWLGFARVRSATVKRIEYMPPDQLDDLPDSGDETRYTVEGRRLIYGQTPSVNLTLQTRYYQHPGALITAGSTWLLVKDPSAYLYAALIEAALWMKNATKAGEFGTLLDKELDELTSESKAAMIGGGRLRAQRPGGFNV